uniref:Uncharacterized protein n=1 Tax=Rhizophora mucronata TaxID=61149 RepID=A0A2P2N5Z5_RHIMU
MSAGIFLTPILQRASTDESRIESNNSIWVLTPHIETSFDIITSHHNVIIKLKNSTSFYQ